MIQIFFYGYSFDGDKLKTDELSIIQDNNNEIIVSSISIFEISLKYSIKKLTLKNITPDKIPELLYKYGYNIENFDHTSFATFYKLPKDIHKDPFDGLIIWDAIRKEYHLLSRDEKFKEYQKYGLKII